MTGDTRTTRTTPTAPPSTWACSTPDLDVKNVEWTAYEIEQGTFFEDEPSELIPPGWYVHGYYDEIDERDAPPIIISIVAGYDEHGCDRSKHLAWHLVGVLTHRHEQSKPRLARLRSFGRGLSDAVVAIIDGRR